MGYPAIEVLHVGSASRDLTDDDPRGWRLGGGVTFAALTTARFGLRTAALVGVDPDAARARELGLLRDAGVDLRIVPLAESPVFRNVETAHGRIQTCVARGRPLPRLNLEAEWVEAPAWSLVPVAREIDDDWAEAVPERAILALGWQGLLRELAAGRPVERVAPSPSALLRRANLVGVSRHDLAPGMEPADLRRFLAPDGALVLTDGDRGGGLLRPDGGGSEAWWRYEAIPPDGEVDPTGAGDTFLAALVASLVRPSIVPDGSTDPGSALVFAAAAASLVLEGPGVFSVPDLHAVVGRYQRGRPVRSDAPGEWTAS